MQESLGLTSKPVSDCPSRLGLRQSKLAGLRVEATLTKCHGNERHDPVEGHLTLVVMVLVVTVCPETVLFVIVRVAWDPLVCMDLLDMVDFRFLFLGCGVNDVYRSLADWMSNAKRNPNT